MVELFLAGATALGTGCNPAEQRSECWSARQNSREAIVHGKLDEAQQKLEQARSVCAGQSADDIRRIEGMIADRREVARALAKEEADEQQAHAFPTEQFIRWATAPVEAFTHSLTNIRCAE
ncbi:MAG TPA: hypothetical protein VFU02_20550, partial [Polyangiaceae bacterium]|nr:hypothetical protein [Polyangiaceae bacterium]